MNDNLSHHRNIPEANCVPGSYGFEVADQTLEFRFVPTRELTPTGEQLALAAGYRSAQGLAILELLPSGEVEDVRPTESVDLSQRLGRFIMGETDRLYWLRINGLRVAWLNQLISGAQLRKLGEVPAEHALYHERSGEPDQLIEAHEQVDLDAPGVESFVSRKPVWKLDVQGVLLEYAVPEVLVQDALQAAGIDLNKSWEIVLKMKGQPKQILGLSDRIDLRPEGIERLRVTPKKVNNGEGPDSPQRAFPLLPADVAHLDRLGLPWETFEDGGRRWLLIHGYRLQEGYTVSQTQLALEIPPTYPGAAIYGFYVSPPLVLISGRPIENTQMRGTLRGTEFHGWSRRREDSEPWDPQTDNVQTQLALVEASLAKEVEA